MKCNKATVCAVPSGLRTVGAPQARVWIVLIAGETVSSSGERAILGNRNNYAPETEELTKSEPEAWGSWER